MPQGPVGGVVWCGVVWCVVRGAWRVPWHVCVVTSNTCMATRCAKPSDHACVDGHTVGGLKRPEKLRALRVVPAHQICSVSKLVWCYWGRYPLRQAEPTSSTSRDKSTHTQRRTGRERARKRERGHREMETWRQRAIQTVTMVSSTSPESTTVRREDTQTRSLHRINHGKQWQQVGALSRHADTQLAAQQPHTCSKCGLGLGGWGLGLGKRRVTHCGLA